LDIPFDTTHSTATYPSLSPLALLSETALFEPFNLRHSGPIIRVPDLASFLLSIFDFDFDFDFTSASLFCFTGKRAISEVFWEQHARIGL
jgi:hypothetical protein